MKNIDNFKYKTKDYFCGYLRNGQKSGLILKFYNQTEVTKRIAYRMPFTVYQFNTARCYHCCPLLPLHSSPQRPSLQAYTAG